MKDEIKLRNIEARIDLFGAMRNAILENETKEIYLPFIGEDRYWHLVGNRIIVIQESSDKIKSVFFINEKEYNRMMMTPIIIKVEGIDEAVEGFSDDLYKTINELKDESYRLYKKINRIAI